MKTISIVIPSYNQQDYLCDAIESCLTQTLNPHEIIVVDDGSTDNSLLIARSYEESNRNVRVVSQVNKGLASARNTGIMNATGDYIQMLDSDDMLMENALEVISTRIEESEADIIAPSFKCFGVSSNVVVLKEYPTLKEFAENNMIGCFSCFRRSALLAIGGYSPRMVKGYEDYHINIDLFKRGYSLSVIQEPLVLYRTRANSMWHDSVKYHDELMDQIKFDHPEAYA